MNKPKVGDEVTRMLAGVLPMKMVITKIENGLIHCDALDFRGDWTFDELTGVEEDEELEWGVKFGASGSYLVEIGQLRRRLKSDEKI